jgi:hypothetical protein
VVLVVQFCLFSLKPHVLRSCRVPRPWTFHPLVPSSASVGFQLAFDVLLLLVAEDDGAGDDDDDDAGFLGVGRDCDDDDDDDDDGFLRVGRDFDDDDDAGFLGVAVVGRDLNDGDDDDAVRLTFSSWHFGQTVVLGSNCLLQSAFVHRGSKQIEHLKR